MADKDALIQPDRGQKATDLHLVDKAGLDSWLKRLSAPQRAAIEAQKFTGGGYQTAIVPDGDGWFAVGGVANTASLSSWCLAKLAEVLPAGKISPGRRGNPARPCMAGRPRNIASTAIATNRTKLATASC